MNILIVEDQEERNKVFRMMFKGDELYITDRPKKAIELLNSVEFDLILLDHDLGGVERGYLDTDDEESGYQVAVAIPNTMNKCTTILVHSWNPHGAKMMHDHLLDSGCNSTKIPFGMFDASLFGR